MVAAEPAPDARLAADQRPARATTARSSPNAVWPAIISAEDGAKIRALLANPERRTNKAARRYLLGGLLVCSHCGERLVAAPAQWRKRRYACAKGPGFSGCGKTYINADEVEQFVTEAVPAPARLARACSARSSGGSAEQPEAQRWLAGDRSRRRRSWRSSPPPTATARSRWTSWRAARKPIEQRLTTARKQLAQVTRDERARPLRRQRRRRCAPIGTRSI